MDIRNFFNRPAVITEQDARPSTSANKFSELNIDQTTQETRPQSKKRKAVQADYDHNYDLKRIRKVQISWLNEYIWLECDENKTVMWCQICRKHPNIADLKSTFFFKTGVTDCAIRLKTVRTHNKTKKHILCMQAEWAKINPRATPIAKCVVRLNDEQLKVMTILFNTAYYCAKEEMAFVKFSSLCDLMSKNGIMLGKNYRNDKQARHFIQHISAVLKDDVKNEISTSRFLAVMADGSTDISVTEEEIIYARTVQKGRPVTSFVDIIAVKHADAAGVLSAIDEGLDTMGITQTNRHEKLISINLDGAAVNMGIRTGVAALLKRQIPNLIIVHCIAHSLELAVMDFIKNSNYIKGKFEETVKGIIKLYQYSPKLRQQLKEIANYLDTVAFHFGLVKQIRWIASQERALSSIEKNWNIIIIHLEDLANANTEKSAKAKNYLKEIKSVKFLNYLYFMMDILDVLAPLSKSFQSDEALIIDLTNLLESSLLQLEEFKTTPGKHFKEYKKLCIQNRHCYKGMSITGDIMQEDQSIQTLLDDVCSSLNHRFSAFNKKPLILFQVFDFVSWSLKKEELCVYGKNEIDELCQHFTGVLTNEERDNMQKEWTKLKVLVNRIKKNNSDCLKVYGHLLQSKPNDLTNILLLIELLFCISPSTAACERGFSNMNRLKTAIRNCLKSTALTDLMRIKIDGPECFKFKPEAAIDHWLYDTKGTRHISGHATKQIAAESDTDSE